MSGAWEKGQQIAGAAVLAVERVNADKTLLAGRQLGYSWADSGCSAKQWLKALSKLLGGESRIDAVIGPGCRSAYHPPPKNRKRKKKKELIVWSSLGCSAACEVTSLLAGRQGIPQISWGWYKTQNKCVM